MKTVTILMLMTALMATPLLAEKQYTPYSETECINGKCTLQTYAGPTFYQDQRGNWQRFDTTLSNTGCSLGYSSCINNNLYQIHVKDSASQSDLIRYEREGAVLSYSPSKMTYVLGSLNITFASASLSSRQNSGNRITFNNSFVQDTRTDFRYTPYLFKEEIVLERNTVLPVGRLNHNGTVLVESEYRLQGGTMTQEEDGLYVLNASGGVAFFMPKSFIRDRRGNTTFLEYEFNATSILMKIPLELLVDDDAHLRYPMTIDPTIALNNESILFDGHINKCLFSCPFGELYARNSASSLINVGGRDEFSIGNVTDIYRGVVEWDISNIPNTATIIDVNVTLNFTTLGSVDRTMYLQHMEQNSSFYSNDELGNSHFYSDIGNGTLYTQQVAVLGFNYYNLSNTTFVNDTQDALNRSWISLGFRALETAKIPDLSGVSTFVSAENDFPETAAVLQIDYLDIYSHMLLYTPLNQTSLCSFDSASLNISYYNQENNMTIYLYGDNQTTIDQQYLLYYQEDIENGYNYSVDYNWSSRQFVVESDTVLLYRFDNLSRYGESQSLVYDYSNQYNGTPQLTYLPNYVGAKFGGDFNVSAVGRINTTCRYDCYKIGNKTYMGWLKPYISDNGGAMQGIAGSYFFSSPYAGFSILQYQDQLAVLSDGLVGVYADNFFLNEAQNWLFFSIVQYDNKTVTIYKNGQSYFTGTLNTVTDLSALDPIIGAAYMFNIGEFDQYFSNQHFNGEMDEFMVINRSLEPYEVRDYYALTDENYYWQGFADTGIVQDYSDMYLFNFTCYPSPSFEQNYQGEIMVVDIPDSYTGASPLEEQPQGFMRKIMTHIWGFLITWFN